MRIATTTITLAALALAAPAQADEVTDILASALAAYEEGDIAYAIEELDYAKQLMQGLQTGELAKFLPAAPEGWTMEVNSDANMAMSMFGGGGATTRGEYENGSESFSITIMVDNPMVVSMGAMLNNTAMMGQMGNVRRMGRQRVLEQNGELSMLVNNRVLVQGSGSDPDLIMSLFETIDLDALGSFGQ
ncbi:hypothetical protein HMH01_10775 [Halovulum dunhuangense]|uniref:Uncharacterized protein n=2 Tax=Halovulum dunhuangense TaxID=1505036 RepID=A0A849L441_9RHOB|nr:hypothetical protein [Halovulum dunhuangense]